MAESAEWWGAINDQIRKQGKRPPRPVKTEERTSMERNSKSENNLAESPPKVKPRGQTMNILDKSIEDLPHQALSASQIPPQADYPTSPVYAQSVSPDYTQPSLGYGQQSPGYAQQTSPGYGQPEPISYPEAQTSPFNTQFQGMNIADQMEMALRSVVKDPTQAAAVPEVEQFRAVDSLPTVKPTSNPWDTFQDESGGW